MTDILVCVGGKHDGRRIHLEKSRAHITMADPLPFPYWDYRSYMQPVQMSIGTYSIYVRKMIGTPAGYRHVLVPCDQEGADIFAALIDGYRKPVDKGQPQ